MFSRSVLAQLKTIAYEPTRYFRYSSKFKLMTVARSVGLFSSGRRPGFHMNTRVMSQQPNVPDPSRTVTDHEACSADNIVWLDMEMTGLEPDKHHVLEVACLVTDKELNIIAEGPDLVIFQPPEVLAKMNEWSLHHHKESGLTHLSQTSQVSLREAEEILLTFVRQWTPFKKCPLGGNTIYIDRLFLKKHMPEFEQHMHYRIVDVSSVKELCSRWYPTVYEKQPNKKDLSKHRAMSDIKASIDELKFYKNNIFRKAQDGESLGSAWY